jgi:octaprenyl-diphosphate synthase
LYTLKLSRDPFRGSLEGRISIEGRITVPLAGEDRVKLQSLQSFVAEELISFEHEYETLLNGELELLRQICEHLKLGKSKRFRPTLVLIASKNGTEIHADAAFAAACVELVHTATLVHDDFIDDAATRRRLPTVNVKWGPAAALIMGDFLYTKVFSLLTARGMDDAMRIIAATTHRMSVAEMMQLESRSRLDLSEEDYFTIISEKTACLIAASCEIGALFHPGLQHHRPALAAFGQNLGMAFQITDDIFDYRGDPKRLGKPVGGDWREGRITLPFIAAWRGASAPLKARLRKAMVTGPDEPRLWAEVREMVHRYGGLEYAAKMAAHYGERAKETLHSLGPHPQTAILSDAVDYVLRRLN